MPDAWNPIDALAAHLQTLPPEIRWLHAQQETIRAKACGLPTRGGPWRRRAERLVMAADHIGLGATAAVAAHMILLIATYIGQFRTMPLVSTKAALFVGIEALREPQLVRQFESLALEPVQQVDERTLTNFSRVGRVGVAALLRETRKVQSEIRSYLDGSAPPHGLDRRDLLAGFVLVGHRYVYLRAWFRRYVSARRSGQTIAFSAASYVPYAAIAAGARAIYFTHGFQGYALVYPDFSAAYCDNRFEAEHLERRLPGCAVTVTREPSGPIKTRRLAAIAGTVCEIWRHELCRSFIAWARASDIPVVVRRHPQDTSGYWDEWRGVTGVSIADGDGELESFLDAYRPRLLATWVSTALLDALAKGVVPVTVDRQDVEVVDTVYPIRRMSLRWPEEKDVVEVLVDDEAACDAFVRNKMREATGMAMPLEQPFFEGGQIAAGEQES